MNTMNNMNTLTENTLTPIEQEVSDTILSGDRHIMSIVTTFNSLKEKVTVLQDSFQQSQKNLSEATKTIAHLRDVCDGLRKETVELSLLFHNKRDALDHEQTMRKKMTTLAGVFGFWAVSVTGYLIYLTLL